MRVFFFCKAIRSQPLSRVASSNFSAGQDFRQFDFFMRVLTLNNVFEKLFFFLILFRYRF